MAEKDLRAIIEQVLMEMNLADNLTSAPKEEPAAVEENCADRNRLPWLKKPQRFCWSNRRWAMAPQRSSV